MAPRNTLTAPSPLGALLTSADRRKVSRLLGRMRDPKLTTAQRVRAGAAIADRYAKRLAERLAARAATETRGEKEHG